MSIPPVMPRRVDANCTTQLVEKLVQDNYAQERKRRRHGVDDDIRQKINSNLPTGQFSYTNVSMHDVWQEMYFNKYGGDALPINQNYLCRHCGMEFGMGYPPEICPRCHQETAFGRLVSDGAFKR